MSAKELLLSNTAEAIQRLTNGISDGVSTATEFLKAQIPDILQQLILYNIADNAVRLLLCVVVLIACGIATVKVYQACEGIALSDDRVMSRVFLITASIIFGCFIILKSIDYAITLLKLCIAPKIWLIEYAVGMVK